MPGQAREDQRDASGVALIIEALVLGLFPE